MYTNLPVYGIVIVNNKFYISQLDIGCWNIDGIWRRINSFRYNKLHDSYVQDIIAKNKIFCFLETHHIAGEEGDLHIDGYQCFSMCRPKDKTSKKPKASGGLACYVHNSIRPGFLKIPRAGTETIWLNLKKDFFNLQNNIYLCFAYCVPASSRYTVGRI